MTDTATPRRANEAAPSRGVNVPKGPAFVWSNGKKAKPLAISQSLRALSMQLRVGESESRALEQVGNEFRKYNIGRSYMRAATLMRVHGATFKDAILADDVLPRTARELIQATETSSAMHGALSRAAKLISQSQNVKKKILTALIQPAFMLGLSLVFLFVSSATIIPNLVGTFASLNAQVPPTIPIVLAVAEVVKWVMGFLIGAIILTVLFWVTWGRKIAAVVQFVDALTVRTPILGPIIQFAATSRLFELLTASLTTGRGEMASLESAGAGCGNEAVHAHVLDHVDRMRTGEARLGEFTRSNLFPPSAGYMIASAPSVKQQIEVMNELAPEYRQEADNRLETFAKTVEPLVNYVVYAIAGVLIVAILIPMYSMFPALMHLSDTTGNAPIPVPGSTGVPAIPSGH